jgi:hypothetical protein
MPESYKPIFPGNAVAPLQSYGLPNTTFLANNRASGDPRDRMHQALLISPGWLAVKKVGYARVTNALQTTFDIVIPSPDQRLDDKPRADIVGLHIPTGARVYRAGFRTVSREVQHGASSDGPLNTPIDETGIFGTATEKLVLASTTPAASAAGSIAAGAITTGSDGTALVLPAGGQVPVGSKGVQVNTGSAVATNADLTLRLYSTAAAGTAIGTGIRCPDIRGGALIICEVCYLVAEAFAENYALNTGGTLYGGTRG